MNIILCGYHWTGCKALEKLNNGDNNIFVYTHKAEKAVPDLIEYCNKVGIKYSLDKISSENMPFLPDVVCSIYYRYIISEDVINLVNGKIFNLHPSLLPKYRGCSSLTWAMINGEKECGYTYHYIDKGCDTGNIIIQKKIMIEDYDTQLTLYNRVMQKAMEDFEHALECVIRGEEGHPQRGESSYYPRGCPYEGEIRDEMEDFEVERFIRAMIYPPYPFAKYKGKEVHSFEEYKRIQSELSK